MSRNNDTCRLHSCVSTENWLRERATVIRYRYTVYLVSAADRNITYSD